MKTFLLTSLLISFIFQQINFAQDSTETSLKKSSFALQFQVSSNFTLRDFQGGTLSCKYFIYDKSALRFGISIYGRSEVNEDNNNIETRGDQYFSLSINSQYIYYLKAIDDVSLFLGGGPSYYQSYFERQGYTGHTNSWSLGLTGVIGVEWFFKKNMSLSAEYGIQFYFEKRMTDNGEISNSTKIFGISDSNMLKFGLSVYL